LDPWRTCLQGANYAAQWFNRKPGPQTATTVRVTAGHITSSIDAALPRAGRISGRVTDRATGKPLRDFCVEATSGDFFGFGSTRRNGDYVIHGLNSRTYHLAFTNCDVSAATEASVRRTATVHVTAPRTTAGINAALPAGGSISGSVLAGSPAAGQGNVCVEADPVSADGLESLMTTSQDGHYALTNLRPGKYRVLFATRTDCDESPNGLVPQWYRAARSRATATIVTVTGGQDTAGIDATLAADGGISGTVTAAATTAPLTGTCVRAIPQAAGQSASFTASANGGYSFDGLIPGQYTVQFSSGCGAVGYAAQWWEDAASAATATVLSVQANTVSTGIDAALSTG
jgi:Carboxypeptidase regulatory-like domain